MCLGRTVFIWSASAPNMSSSCLAVFHPASLILELRLLTDLAWLQKTDPKVLSFSLPFIQSYVCFIIDKNKTQIDLQCHVIWCAHHARRITRFFSSLLLPGPSAQMASYSALASASPCNTKTMKQFLLQANMLIYADRKNSMPSARSATFASSCAYQLQSKQSHPPQQKP